MVRYQSKSVLPIKWWFDADFCDLFLKQFQVFQSKFKEFRCIGFMFWIHVLDFIEIERACWKCSYAGWTVEAAFFATNFLDLLIWLKRNFKSSKDFAAFHSTSSRKVYDEIDSDLILIVDIIFRWWWWWWWFIFTIPTCKRESFSSRFIDTINGRFSFIRSYMLLDDSFI